MVLKLSPYDIECLEKAKGLIEADLSRHIPVAELAQKVAMGKTKLKIGFQQLYRYPVYTYLQRQRMILAMELLTCTYKTLKQIARHCGFHHNNNFITAFNRHYGITPGQVRKNAPQH